MPPKAMDLLNFYKYNYTLCNNEFENSSIESSVNNQNCPYWGPWRSIGEFGDASNKCSKKCGFGKRRKIRDCYIRGKMQKTAEKCINEIPR